MKKNIILFCTNLPFAELMVDKLSEAPLGYW